MKKILMLTLVLVLTLTTLTACAQTDVVGKVAITSFEQVLSLSDVQPDKQYGGWSLAAPDQSARFFFSSDFKTSVPHDVMLEVDAIPFIEAGLDPAKLPAGIYLDGMLMFGQDLSDTAFPDGAKATALDSFKELVKLNREAVGYHEKLDHYGVDAGNGNKFEWAKDLTTNDKDIVFVLDPKVLTDAGVDPARVTGWVFAAVEVKDDAGKPIEVEKFLKPFDLK